MRKPKKRQFAIATMIRFRKWEHIITHRRSDRDYDQLIVTDVQPKDLGYIIKLYPFKPSTNHFIARIQLYWLKLRVYLKLLK